MTVSIHLKSLLENSSINHIKSYPPKLLKPNRIHHSLVNQNHHGVQNIQTLRAASTKAFFELLKVYNMLHSNQDFHSYKPAISATMKLPRYTLNGYLRLLRIFSVQII